MENVVNWATIIGTIAGVIGAYVAWRALRTRKPHSDTEVTGSKRVRVTGGEHTTRTRVDDSQDVDIS